MSVRDKRNTTTQLNAQKMHEYKKLMKIIRNRYSYAFLNDEDEQKYERSLPFRYLEKVVSDGGRGAIYDAPNIGLAFYKAVVAGNLDIYGRPATWLLYTANGRNMHKVDADDPKLLILQDGFTGEALSIVADRYANMLGKIRETLNTNIAAMRQPYLIQANKDSLMEVKLALRAVNEEPEVILDKNFNFDDAIKITELKTVDNLESLEVEYHNVLSRFLEEIGFSSILITKKERLVSAEADSNGSTLIAFDNEPYENRLKFVKDLERKFGIKVKLIKSNIDILRDFAVTKENRPVVDDLDIIKEEPIKTTEVTT